MQGPEKNSYQEFDNEKNSCGSKIPHLHHNFSNGPSLTQRMAHSTFKSGAAQLPSVPSYVWTEALTAMFFVPAQELSSIVRTSFFPHANSYI